MIIANTDRVHLLAHLNNTDYIEQTKEPEYIFISIQNLSGNFEQLAYPPYHCLIHEQN